MRLIMFPHTIINLFWYTEWFEGFKIIFFDRMNSRLLLWNNSKQSYSNSEVKKFDPAILMGPHCWSIFLAATVVLSFFHLSDSSIFLLSICPFVLLFIWSDACPFHLKWCWKANCTFYTHSDWDVFIIVGEWRRVLMTSLKCCLFVMRMTIDDVSGSFLHLSSRSWNTEKTY